MKKIAAMLALAALAMPAAGVAQQQQHRPGQSQGQDRGKGNDRGPQGRPAQQAQQPARPNNNNAHQHARPNNAPQQGRPAQGNGKFYADQHYRDGAHYTPTRITRNTRIYRGGNGRYYCRRSDGTTGLIAGIAIGGILGNRLGDGDSALLSTILGAGVGGVLGREIDRGNVQCR